MREYKCKICGAKSDYKYFCSPICENDFLRKENNKYKQMWRELKSWVDKHKSIEMYKYMGTFTTCDEVYNKMQELEG